MGDHERPLNQRGKQDAPKMGALLKAHDIVPQLIISSTAERALQTAEAAALAADFEGELVTTSAFYLADPEAYLERLAELPDDITSVMVVGHNPGMEELVAELTGVADRLTTANLVQVALPITHWRDLDEETEGELLNWWRPKELM